LKCPVCQHTDSSVVRTDQEAHYIKRRRQCSRCGHRWTTGEAPIEELQNTIKIKAVAAAAAKALAEAVG
jgi:transcriptional regulator NrdR family protein